MWYLWLKLIHIVSSTLLFGTGLGSAYYMFRAHLSKDIPAIAYASKAVVFADWAFTLPAVIIQPITGLAMIHIAGFSLASHWIYISILLYLLVGACWLPVVWLQIKMKQMVHTAQQQNESLPALYYRYMRYWFFLGWPAFIGVVIIFYLMVFKPS